MSHHLRLRKKFKSHGFFFLKKNQGRPLLEHEAEAETHAIMSAGGAKPRSLAADKSIPIHPHRLEQVQHYTFCFYYIVLVIFMFARLSLDDIRRVRPPAFINYTFFSRYTFCFWLYILYIHDCSLKSSDDIRRVQPPTFLNYAPCGRLRWGPRLRLLLLVLFINIFFCSPNHGCFFVQN